MCTALCKGLFHPRWAFPHMPFHCYSKSVVEPLTFPLSCSCTGRAPLRRCGSLCSCASGIQNTGPLWVTRNGGILECQNAADRVAERFPLSLLPLGLLRSENRVGRNVLSLTRGPNRKAPPKPPPPFREGQHQKTKQLNELINEASLWTPSTERDLGFRMVFHQQCPAWLKMYHFY